MEPLDKEQSDRESADWTDNAADVNIKREDTDLEGHVKLEHAAPELHETIGESAISTTESNSPAKRTTSYDVDTSAPQNKKMRFHENLDDKQPQPQSSYTNAPKGSEREPAMSDVIARVNDHERGMVTYFDMNAFVGAKGESRGNEFAAKAQALSMSANLGYFRPSWDGTFTYTRHGQPLPDAMMYGDRDMPWPVEELLNKNIDPRRVRGFDEPEPDEIIAGRRWGDLTKEFDEMYVKLDKRMGFVASVIPTMPPMTSFPTAAKQQLAQHAYKEMVNSITTADDVRRKAHLLMLEASVLEEMLTAKTNAAQQMNGFARKFDKKLDIDYREIMDSATRRSPDPNESQ